MNSDLLTRVLASLKHLHTLHGPCDDSPSGDGAPTCLHAAVIVELERLTSRDTRICRICDGGPGNEGVCLCGSKAWEVDPPFQAVAPFPCEPAESLSHDLASAMLSAMAAGGTILPATEIGKRLFFECSSGNPLTSHWGRACAACGADILATEHPDTNLCGRCAQ